MEKVIRVVRPPNASKEDLEAKAILMLEQGVTVKLVHLLTGLSEDAVKQIKKTNNINTSLT